MASTVNKAEPEFREAANNWHLEKLYVDIASIKGKSLTPVEKKILRGLLCGYSPSEIANKVYNSSSSSAVRVYLSNGLYKYIQDLVNRTTGEIIKLKNWSSVTNLLEKAGYKLNNINQDNFSKNSVSLNQIDSYEFRHKAQIKLDINKHDWDEKFDLNNFYGRTEEFTQLQKWISKDMCRIVAILGMGGIGKTALAVRISKEIEQQFEFVIWRSLRHAPEIVEVLLSIIKVLSNGEERLPATAAALMTQLMNYLRSHRCLLILDCVEAVLASSNCLDSDKSDISAGYYRQGYEDYGELFRRISEEKHCSCLIITSRETPQEIAALEGENLPIHSLHLNGLKTLAGQELLCSKGLIATQEENRLLIKCYGGNPLILKIVATTIKDIFKDNIPEFLAQNSLVFGDICKLLDQQFNRLSNSEKMIMYWLTLNPQLTPIRILRENFVPGMSKSEQIEAFESLQRRSLICKNSATWMLPPVIRTYFAEKLVTQVFAQMENKQLAMLISMGLINPKINNAVTGVTLENIILNQPHKHI